MATVPINVVEQKFSHVHPNHLLMRHSDDREYTCHGCKISDSGARFRCHACTVDVHVYCSDCPQELSSFLHSHRLALVPRMNDRRCDVCRESINGMFYRCNHCDFDVHPICTQLPEQVRHVIDNRHKLRLRNLSSGRCSVCEIDCSSLWVYACDICRYNIHPKCLLKPYGDRQSEMPASSSGTRRIPYALPWMTTQQPHSPHGYVPAPWMFPNYGHNTYPPHPRPNHGAPMWFPLIGVSSSLVENLMAGSMVEFVFGSLGF